MAGKGAFCRGSFFGHTIKGLLSAKKHSIIFSENLYLNRKRKRFNPRSIPPASHSSAPSKSQVVAFFVRYAAGGIRTLNLSLACNLLYNWTTHSFVSILYFLSPTYYTKLSVNYLFEALNEFKLKSCQLQSSITFWDLRLLFWLFSHPKSFTKFKVHFAMCQI